MSAANAARERSANVAEKRGTRVALRAIKRFTWNAMSKETSKDNPRQRTDLGSHSQTDEPWSGNPEKEQRNDDFKPDLERWQESDTHQGAQLDRPQQTGLA